MNKGYLCPICKTYSDKQTEIKRLPDGRIQFKYGCGHITKERLKTIGYFSSTLTI